MKKLLILTITFCMILFSFTYLSIYAADVVNGTKNTANTIGGAIANTANNAKNAIQTGEDKVENGLNSAKNTIVDSTKNTTTNAKNTGDNVMGHIDNANSNYNATRTATNTGFLGMTSTGWTWLILGIVGIVIVGLVWYYGSQYDHSNYSDGE